MAFGIPSIIFCTSNGPLAHCAFRTVLLAAFTEDARTHNLDAPCKTVQAVISLAPDTCHTRDVIRSSCIKTSIPCVALLIKGDRRRKLPDRVSADVWIGKSLTTVDGTRQLSTQKNIQLSRKQWTTTGSREPYLIWKGELQTWDVALLPHALRWRGYRRAAWQEGSRFNAMSNGGNTFRMKAQKAWLFPILITCGELNFMASNTLRSGFSIWPGNYVIRVRSLVLGLHLLTKKDGEWTGILWRTSAPSQNHALLYSFIHSNKVQMWTITEYDSSVTPITNAIRLGFA